jgi:hypothetical protein
MLKTGRPGANQNLNVNGYRLNALKRDRRDTCDHICPRASGSGTIALNARETGASSIGEATIPGR